MTERSEMIVGNFNRIKEKLTASLDPVNNRFVTSAMQASIDGLVAEGWQVIGQSFVDKDSPERGNSVQLIRGDEEGYDTKTVTTDRSHEKAETCGVTGFVGENGEWSTKY